MTADCDIAFVVILAVSYPAAGGSYSYLAPASVTSPTAGTTYITDYGALTGGQSGLTAALTLPRADSSALAVTTPTARPDQLGLRAAPSSEYWVH